MAIVYLSSTDGDDADDGSTWALAKATLASAVTAAGTSGTIYARDHTDSHTTSQDIIGGNDPGDMLKLIGCKTGTTNEPPQEADIITDPQDANIPTFVITNTNTLGFGGSLFCRGWHFECGRKMDTGHAADPNQLHFRDCLIKPLTTASGGQSGFVVIADQTGYVIWENVYFEVGNSNWISLEKHVRFEWRGGKTIGNFADNLIQMGAFGCTADIIGVDLSSHTHGGLTEGINTSSQAGSIRFMNCFFPSGYELVNGTLNSGMEVRAINCDTASDHTNPIINSEYETRRGSIITETTVTRDTGSASDGTTDWSYKMTPNVDETEEHFNSLKTPWVAQWVGTGSQTLTVYIHNTIGDMQDDEVALEVFSPNETAAASTSQYRRQITWGDYDSPANLTDDTTNWNSGSAFSQKIAVTINPDYEGPLYWRIHYAKRFASSPTPLYVDSKPDVA